MAGVVTVSFQLDQLVTGDNVNSTTSLTPNSDGYYEVTGITLASGHNSVTVPSWAAGVQICPPSTNTEALTLKGASGDTGIRINPAASSLLYFDPAAVPSTIDIDAAGTTPAPTFFRWF